MQSSYFQFPDVIPIEGRETDQTTVIFLDEIVITHAFDTNCCARLGVGLFARLIDLFFRCFGRVQIDVRLENC